MIRKRVPRSSLHFE
uniref:Uncharacterized protein n=1 Tax=Lepeophtheirus salmonis TaxID=72036 RepID=A0A0K2U7Y0_LEPSM